VTEPDLSPLEELVKGLGARPVRIDAMPGGASTRRYFRVLLADGTRVVGVHVPAGDGAEEIEKGAGPRRWPFLEVRELLEARGVRVPHLFAEDTGRGWLVIEDLGDETLAEALVRDPESKEALYVRAVRDLARAQESLARLPEGSVVRTRAFDEDLLRWEIDHFREWGLEARGIQLDPSQRAAFDGIAARIASRIATWPRSFVHRDYQSRNLMLVGGELVWIDFQDALMGPRVYDLVALLNDSYQQFDRAFVESRLDDYAKERGLGPEERERLGFEFDMVTVQRKLKDAGRFVFIDRMRGNKSFLRFVAPTVKKVASSLARLQNDQDMRALSRLLSELLPEEMA